MFELSTSPEPPVLHQVGPDLPEILFEQEAPALGCLQEVPGVEAPR